MHQFRNILVVCDEHGVSAGLHERVRWLAQANGAVVTFTEVVETGPGRVARLLSPLPVARAEAVRQGIVEAHRERLNRLAEPLRATSATVRTAVDQGTAFLEIIRRVMRDGHDLVIKDAGGRGGWPFLRGTDMHLLRKCPCPVWILNAHGEPKARRILAAVDTLSEEAAHEGLNRAIMDLATSLARQDGAALDVVAVWCIPEEWALTHGRVRLPDEEVRAILTAEEERSAARLDGLVAEFQPKAGPMVVHHLKGYASEVIVRHVEEREVDTIVMGTVGRVGVAGFFIGNTAETILARVSCSVLAVKPEGFVSPVEPEPASGVATT